MLNTLVLSVTYKCPIECKLCGLSCNPRRKERMSLAFMLKTIDEVASYGGVPHVTFTGGEPFLLRDDLLQAIERAKHHGMSTRVVTNAYWAKSADKASEIVKRFKDHGLTEINISVDDMHQEHIPIEYVKNAHDACVDHDVFVLLAHKALSTSKVTVEYLEEVFGRELLDLLAERDRIASLPREARKSAELPRAYIYGTHGCIPVGPGAEETADSDLDYLYDPKCAERRCDSVLRDIIIGPTGNLHACCGVTMTDIPELNFDGVEQDGLVETMRRANDDLIVNWLALEGPYGILLYVRKKDPTFELGSKIVGSCHLCRELLTNPKVREMLRNLDRDKAMEIIYKRMGLDSIRKDYQLARDLYDRPVMPLV